VDETGVQERAITRPGRGGRVVRHPSPKEYIRIAIVLAIVTAGEVGVYYADLPRSALIPILFVFAAIKFLLVVLWYMHLRFDSRTYARFFTFKTFAR
jgi:cytochrome c oxidase subunit 4